VGGQGEAVVDCGAFPGTVDRAPLLVAAVGLVATSQHEAWIQPEATADHTIDEHFFEPIKAMSSFFANDLLLVWVVNDNRLRDPVTGIIPRVYGDWNVGWVWN
jgi:hypothetical protein